MNIEHKSATLIWYFPCGKKCPWCCVYGRVIGNCNVIYSVKSTGRAHCTGNALVKLKNCQIEKWKIRTWKCKVCLLWEGLIASGYLNIQSFFFTANCSLGWLRDPYKNTCLKMNSTALMYSEAESYCVERYGGNLAVFDHPDTPLWLGPLMAADSSMNTKHLSIAYWQGAFSTTQGIWSSRKMKSIGLHICLIQGLSHWVLALLWIVERPWTKDLLGQSV